MYHKLIVIDGGRPQNPLFKWVNTGLGNIKSAISGTCRGCDPQHTKRYPAAYEWSFNRRFDLAKNVQRLARVAACTAPTPQRSITDVSALAEMAG